MSIHNAKSFSTGPPRKSKTMVVMSVTPQIADTGAVTLIVRPTISRQSGEVEDPVNKGSFIPEITVQEMESVLKVDSAQTAVLGGLIPAQTGGFFDWQGEVIPW